MKQRVTFAILSLLVFCASGTPKKKEVSQSAFRQWTLYGGGSDNIRYSALDEINLKNVRQLQVAWTFDTGDAFKGSQIQHNPIIVNGVLYATSPKLNVIALDAATGKLIWRFDPHKGTEGNQRLFRNRGVTFWEGEGKGRIFVVVDHYLYALGAQSGRPIVDFGEEGRVDLRKDLGRDVQGLTMTVTSPGVVYKNILVMGSQVNEGLPTPPGHIRGYDVRTGKLVWRFNTIPHPGEYGYETWPPEAWMHIGAANSWAGMSVDVERGLVFANTGSAAYDFYGGNRIGDNLFANCLIALKADTGKRVWHFQFVRHDLWDRDLPAPPVLLRIKRNGKLVDAVAQATKSGHIFVFDRDTGKPVFPIEYRRVSKSKIPGEVTADTQPFPLSPPPVSRQKLTEDELTTRTPEAHRSVLEQLRSLENDGPFTPPGFKGAVVFPGLDGGAEWGGQAFDPKTGILYVNANEMPWIIKMVERPRKRERMHPRDLYLSYCASCHRPDFLGAPPQFPALTNLSKVSNEKDVYRIISTGVGRMPGYAQLGGEINQALTRYLLYGENQEVDATKLPDSVIDPPYIQDGYRKFLDPDGYPAVKPPWGTLTAINMNTAKFAWQIPLGEIPELEKQGLRNTGSENYGGPVVTAGGLLFIGATNYDNKFRAFDKITGKLLWETTLPAAGNATPSVYEVNGRQFVVIAAGGGKSGRPSGGTYVAFALPEHKN